MIEIQERLTFYDLRGGHFREFEMLIQKRRLGSILHDLLMEPSDVISNR